RQQALLRVTERTMGLAPPAASAKEGRESRKKRQRKPRARALQAAAVLQEAAGPAAAPSDNGLATLRPPPWGGPGPPRHGDHCLSLQSQQVRGRPRRRGRPATVSSGEVPCAGASPAGPPPWGGCRAHPWPTSGCAPFWRPSPAPAGLPRPVPGWGSASSAL